MNRPNLTIVILGLVPSILAFSAESHIYVSGVEVVKKGDRHASPKEVGEITREFMKMLKKAGIEAKYRDVLETLGNKDKDPKSKTIGLLIQEHVQVTSVGGKVTRSEINTTVLIRASGNSMKGSFSDPSLFKLSYDLYEKYDKAAVLKALSDLVSIIPKKKLKNRPREGTGEREEPKP